MKILVYPTDINPYQKLLYQALRKKYDVKIVFLNGEKANFYMHVLGLVLFPYKLLFLKLQKFDILHIHWPAFNIPLINNLLFRYVSTLNFMICLFAIKILHYKVVWTVHNIEDHEKTYINDSEAIKQFSKLAQAKITHANNMKQLMEKKHLDTKNIFTIPHGNYTGAYKNTLSKSEARKMLDIKEKDYIILFFGQIRPYKDIAYLLKSMENIFPKYPHVKLIIAGKCTNITQKNIINIYKKKYDKKIILDPRYIPDSEIEKYFKSADIIAYPFKKITTSGSVILGITFGKSLIYPTLGALKSIPQNIGFAYDPKEPKALEKAIKQAIKNHHTLKEREKNARKFSQSLSWNAIAEETFKVYKSVSGNV